MAPVEPTFAAELNDMAAPRLRTPSDLIDAGLIAPDRKVAIESVVKQFSMAITPDLAALINPADPNDPIARQFVPDIAELQFSADESPDPTDDFRLSPIKGIVHRYPDRVLLKPTHFCPVYCRFCFRREQVGTGGESLTDSELGAAIDYIRLHSEIWEVILSGGDPCALSPRRIRGIVSALDAIDHVGVIRFHTRVPVVDPSRVSDELIDALAANKIVWVIIHANHPRELTPSVREACRRLRMAGIPLLSQSALLRGINDDALVLTSLFRGLVAMGVKPYYLHHGDLARGTAHFRTALSAGQDLIRRLRGRVSGLCQPTLILDIPGGHGKVPVGPCHAMESDEPGKWRIEDNDGHWHDYPPSSENKR